MRKRVSDGVKESAWITGWVAAMFQAWRLKLREAEEMLRAGQLDEAGDMLLEEDLRQFLPGRRLSTQVAAELSERAKRRAIQGDLTSAWRDLHHARQLAGEIESVVAAKQELAAVGMREVESGIAAGEFGQAIRAAEELTRHGVQDEMLRRFKEVARRLQSAQSLIRQGKFSLAESQVRSAGGLMPDCPLIQPWRDEYHRKSQQFRQLNEALHRAVAAEDWSQAAALSEELLELSPDCSLARDIRRQAWSRVGAKLEKSGRLTITKYPPVAAEATSADTDHEMVSGAAVAELSSNRRFLLWVDGVGGYLVCLGDEVLLGQSTSCGQVDVPICADISRRHAQICRRGDGYVIEPFQRTRVNDQVIRDKTLLSSGDEIELGESVRLRFRQPHALSASARLDLVSRHRTSPSADGILLMAESCVLGPKLQNHVVCQDWQNDVVLYRRDDELHCRAMDAIEIDGQLCDGVGHVSPNSHVIGADFSMSLEELT
jgi:hypothetical protein